MDFSRTALDGVVLITPGSICDERGHFAEIFRRDFFRAHCGEHEFVQENRSLSVCAGTVRGLHFQIAPRAQGKLVTCLSGALLDVVVDVRRGSLGFGRHHAVELSAENGRQLWIPAGFAHGFCTLMPNTRASYRTTEYYSREHERGIFWNDPDLGIAWPVEAARAIVSAKDKALPRLGDWRESQDFWVAGEASCASS